MMTQEKNAQKNKRGRPAIGTGERLVVTARPGMSRAITLYSEQTGMKRTDAVRSLLKLGLAAYNASQGE